MITINCVIKKLIQSNPLVSRTMMKLFSLKLLFIVETPTNDPKNILLQNSFHLKHYTSLGLPKRKITSKSFWSVFWVSDILNKWYKANHTLCSKKIYWSINRVITSCEPWLNTFMVKEYKKFWNLTKAFFFLNNFFYDKISNISYWKMNKTKQ